MMAVEELLSFIWRHWKLFAGGAVALVLVIMLMIAKGDARHWQKLDTLHVAQRDAEIAKNAVNLESITRLTDALDAKNAESEARARAYSDTKAADAQTIADLISDTPQPGRPETRYRPLRRSRRKIHPARCRWRLAEPCQGCNRAARISGNMLES